jgi:hypothetical protein
MPYDAGPAPDRSRFWLPLPEFAGFATRDATAARDAGLTVRSLSETARDTLSWFRTNNGPVTGLTIEEERVLLKEWRETATRNDLSEPKQR